MSTADPLIELLAWLEDGEQPPLAWVVRHGRGGACDPAQGAWEASRDANAMVRLLHQLGLAYVDVACHARGLGWAARGGRYSADSTAFAPVVEVRVWTGAAAAPGPPSPLGSGRMVARGEPTHEDHTGDVLGALRAAVPQLPPLAEIQTAWAAARAAGEAERLAAEAYLASPEGQAVAAAYWGEGKEE